MKKIISIIAVLFALNVNATTISCTQTGQETQGLVVKATITGEFSVASQDNVNFENITFEYSIDEGEDYSWSRGKEKFTNLSNEKNYRPRKYKGHMKFSALINGYNSEEFPGYGALDLLIPSKSITEGRRSKFTSYLILTAMDDHFGGTISLNCKVK